MRFFILFFTCSTYSMPLFLEVGETLTLPSPPHEKITLSKKNLVFLQEKQNSIHIQAQNTGSLILTQGSSQKIIYVVEDKKGWKQFFHQIAKEPWLEVEFLKDKTYVQGHLYRFRAWKHLFLLSQKHLIPYTFNAQVSEDVQKEAQNFFESKIKSDFEINWNSPVTVTVPKNFKQEKFFSQWGISTIQDPHKSELSPFVEIQVIVAQINENLSKNLNIKLENFSFLEDSEQIAEFYRGKGEGNILSSSKMLVESGQTIDYLFGGEIPVLHTHLESLSTSVTWKPYGFQLKLSPVIDSKNRITLHIASNISELDPSYSSKGAPATKTFRWETKLTLKDGQTLPLSELTRNQSGSFSHKPFSFLNLARFLNLETGTSKSYSKALVLVTPQIIPR